MHEGVCDNFIYSTKFRNYVRTSFRPRRLLVFSIFISNNILINRTSTQIFYEANNRPWSTQIYSQ